MTNPTPNGQSITSVGWFRRMPTGSSTANLKPQEDPVTQDQTTTDLSSRSRSTQTKYLWCGYTHEGECEPGMCPPHVKLRTGHTMPCGCFSHDPVDHQAS